MPVGRHNNWSVKPALAERSPAYDPRQGAEAFVLEDLREPAGTVEPERSNYFTIYWVASGAGEFWADAGQHAFQADQLMFFVPYQYLRFSALTPIEGTILRFHANFLCVETFHAETGCSGMLFNDPYGIPVVTADDRTKSQILEILTLLRREQSERQLAYEDAMLSAMKILLIVAARLKSRSPINSLDGTVDYRHPVLGPLRDLIETHYRELHAPAEYAALLHMTPKTLGRCVREQLGKTLTDLIRERILTHAKWQLLHTLKSVKEVAAEVGFRDELYFSRLFKKATGVSPTFFREFETEIRGGSNLSMT